MRYYRFEVISRPQISGTCAMARFRRSRFLFTLVLLALSSLVSWEAAKPAAAKDETDAAGAKLVLHARKRLETKTGSGRYHAVTGTLEWDPHKTAVVICDM